MGYIAGKKGERMAGKEAFRKGMDIYFERNDGKAVTCDDFVKAIEDGSGLDLRQFIYLIFVADVWVVYIIMLHLSASYISDGVGIKPCSNLVITYAVI